MQEEFFPAAEKILFDIENILKKDEYLQSFEIIFANDNENKSPVYHESNSLGLASWCIQPLYCYVYNSLIKFRRNKFRREDPGIVTRWLLGVLLLNPDANTFWNMRRKFVRNGRLDAQQELRFVKIILYRRAKCFEAFSYRRLLIEHILVNPQHLNSNVESFLQEEISIASISADRYSNNYHAWNHRQYIVLTYETAVPVNFRPFLVSEWVSSEKWCRQHISDYGGLSYRQFLLKQFLFDSEWNKSNIFVTPDYLIQRLKIIFSYIKINSKKYNDISYLYKELSYKILDMLHGKKTCKTSDVHYEQVLVALSYWIEDCIFNQSLIGLFPSHESLWYHRRFLAYSLRSLIISYLNYSCYKSELFSPSYVYSQRNQNKSHESSKNLLEIAFKNHNREIMISAKQHNGYQNDLVNSFENFLVTVDLKI